MYLRIYLAGAVLVTGATTAASIHARDVWAEKLGKFGSPQYIGPPDPRPPIDIGMARSCRYGATTTPDLVGYGIICGVLWPLLVPIRFIRGAFLPPTFAPFVRYDNIALNINGLAAFMYPDFCYDMAWTLQTFYGKYKVCGTPTLRERWIGAYPERLVRE
jgi:hypothetical protein